MEATSVFETKSCSRCGGSGKFSFNQMNGDRCFGCGGSGLQRTKRGNAARKFYLESLERPASEVRVGDSVYTTVGASAAMRWHTVAAMRWHTVEAIRPDPINGGFWLDINWKGRRCAWGMSEASRVMCVTTDAERAAKLEAAVAYQATLDGNGKPR